MSFDIGRIRKSAHRVQKFVRKNSKRPGTRAIHNLRTSARSLETTFATLGMNSKKRVKRLLHHLRTIRKRAGKVRDMDVLTAHTLTVKQDGEQDCLVQLLEYLGAKRNTFVKDLRLVVDRAGRQLKRDLKRNRKLLEERLGNDETDKSRSFEAVPLTMARAIKLAAELNFPATLNRDNLHPYRLKIKELRNVLQLSAETGNKEFLRKLGDAKDTIGEWHDWQELVATATRLLNHGRSCKLIKRLKQISEAKYQRALSITSNFRNTYLRSAPAANRRARLHKPAALSSTVLRATSAIAA